MAGNFYTCSMCSFHSRSLQSLTKHICKSHRSDPRFHVYCKSCLRSYSKWDSYRKHIERGCQKISCGTDSPIDDATADGATVDDASIDATEPNTTGSTIEDMDNSSTSLTAVSQQWQQAAYILSIKEKHILSQVAVDHGLSTTSMFLSEILSGLMDDIRNSGAPGNILQTFKLGFAVHNGLY